MRSAWLILLFAPLAHADFVVPTAATYGWDRPTTLSPFSSFQAWEQFATTTGPNNPQTVFGAGTGDPAVASFGAPNNFRGFGGPAASIWTPLNAAGNANAFDFGAPANGGFVTGGGNIYSPGGVVLPRIIVPSNVDSTPGNLDAGITTLLLQIRNQGTDLDPASVRLFDPVSNSEILPTSTTTLATAVLGGFGGTLTDRLFAFHVIGNADAYEFRMSASGSSLSLDRVAVDTHYTASPAPATLFALPIAAALACFRRRVSA